MKYMFSLIAPSSGKSDGDAPIFLALKDDKIKYKVYIVKEEQDMEIDNDISEATEKYRKLDFLI